MSTDYITVDEFVKTFPNDTLRNASFIVVYFEGSVWQYAYYKFAKPLSSNIVLNDKSIKHVPYIDLLYHMKHKDKIAVYEDAYTHPPSTTKAPKVFKLIINVKEPNTRYGWNTAGVYNYKVSEITNDELITNIQNAHKNGETHKQHECDAATFDFAYGNEDETYNGYWS